MNEQLRDAIKAGAAVIRNPPRSAIQPVGYHLPPAMNVELIFAEALQKFFLTLPDGAAREILSRKQPFHNWQTAFAAEISLMLDADFLTES